MKTGIIYRAFNKQTAKSYIGQTCRTLEKRKKEHFYDAKKFNLYHFHRALNKYDYNDWEWTVLESNVDKKDIDTKEVQYIKLFNSYNDGYNGTIGGQGGVRDGCRHTLYNSKLGYITATAKEFEVKYGIKEHSVRSLTRGDKEHCFEWSVNPIPRELKVNPLKSITYYTVMFEGTMVRGYPKELIAAGINTDKINRMKRGLSGKGYSPISAITHYYCDYNLINHR